MPPRRTDRAVAEAAPLEAAEAELAPRLDAIAASLEGIRAELQV
jgi:hypothetical protein